MCEERTIEAHEHLRPTHQAMVAMTRKITKKNIVTPRNLQMKLANFT